MKPQKTKQNLPQIPVVYAPADNIVMRVIPELAAEIGFNESIVFLQIAFWIKQSKTFVDGRYWTYQSLRDMQKKAFSFWSIMTTKRAVDSLSKQGLLIIDNHNKRKGDDTQWFSLHVENISHLTSVVIVMETIEGGVSKSDRVYQDVTATDQNVTTLPENTIDNTDKKNLAPKGERKPNPIFDAVAKHLFDIADTSNVNGKGGRIGKVASVVKSVLSSQSVDEARVDELLKRFADSYRDRQLNPPTGDVLDARLTAFIQNTRQDAQPKKPTWSSGEEYL